MDVTGNQLCHRPNHCFGLWGFWKEPGVRTNLIEIFDNRKRLTKREITVFEERYETLRILPGEFVFLFSGLQVYELGRVVHLLQRKRDSDAKRC